jgi:hypothetical protein
MNLWYTDSTLDTTRSGQIADRYSQAIDQLGSANTDIRLGGIYALQAVAQDSTEYQHTIMELLTNYAQAHSQDPPPPALLPWSKTRAQPLSADVRAALLVVGGRDTAKDDFIQVLDRADFHGRDLSRLTLRAASLYGAHLSEANLGNTNLSGATLRRAGLTRASMINAVLRRADLREARLIDANLANADLREADLRGAELTGANLCGANLTGAKGVDPLRSKCLRRGGTAAPAGPSPDSVM